MRRLSRFYAAFALLAAVAGPLPAAATPSVASASISPDLQVDLDAASFADEDVAVDDLMGLSVPAALGPLPAAGAVTAYHLLPGGDQLFVLETTTELPGGILLQPRDVARYDGVGYTLEFDGSAAGVPAGAAIDAVTRSAGGDLLLSFDITVDLGGGLFAADEDLVQWNGTSFALSFDGSAEGVPETLDLDAAHDAGGGRLGVSFDGSGSVGGVAFADEDVLLFRASGATWDLVYDGSSLHAALAAADVEAVALPEPAVPLLLGTGLVTVLLLGRRRMRAPGRGRSACREEGFPCV